MAGAAGRLLRGAAAFAASLALLGGSAGVVRAEEPVYAIQTEAALRLPPAGSRDQPPSYHAYLLKPKGDAPRDYVFTWDFSELAGFVDVGVKPHSGDRCTIDGTRMTCRHRYVNDNPLVPTPLLRAVRGARDGSSGHLRVTAESEGVTVRGASTLVRVGGAELFAVRVPLDHRPFVGEVQRPRYSFVNKGTLPAGRVLLALTVTRGMDLPVPPATASTPTCRGRWRPVSRSARSRAPSSPAPPTAPTGGSRCGRGAGVRRHAGVRVRGRLPGRTRAAARRPGPHEGQRAVRDHEKGGLGASSRRRCREVRHGVRRALGPDHHGSPGPRGHGLRRAGSGSPSIWASATTARRGSPSSAPVTPPAWPPCGSPCRRARR
ncbi:hypothetical protein ACFQ60_29110 [Streptomyces zhihengii]